MREHEDRPSPHPVAGRTSATFLGVFRDVFGSVTKLGETMLVSHALALAFAGSEPMCASLPATMRAVVATAPSPGGLSGNWSGIDFVSDRPVPCPPGANNALIRVSAAGVNPYDYKTALATSYHGIPCKYPRVLGSDVAGHVVAAGPQCDGIAVGDAVFGSASVWPHGSFAEYAVAPCSELARAPIELTAAELAALPVAAGTSLDALLFVGPWDDPNRTVVLTTGSGGTGIYGIQFARMLGAARVVVASSAPNAPLLRSLGATEVVDYHAHSLWEALPDNSVDVVYDNLAEQSHIADAAMACLRRGGIFTSLLSDGTAYTNHSKPGVEQRDYGHFGAHTPKGAIYAQLARIASRGGLRSVIERSFNLADVAAAFDLSAAGHVVGKLVIGVAPW